MLEKIKNLLCKRDKSWYVVADSADNSITFSPALAKHIKKATKTGKLMTVAVDTSAGREFAIILDPPYNEKETQLADIQYNTKHRCFGYESLVPTVNRMFDTYGILLGSICKLTMSGPYRTQEGDITYYIIHRPSKK